MIKMLFALSSAFWLMACDPQRKGKCEWYILPELEHKETVGGEWVPLCARNFVTGKQKCFLKAKVDFAEKIYNKPFKFDEIELDQSAFPREILSVKTCKPES